MTGAAAGAGRREDAASAGGERREDAAGSAPLLAVEHLAVRVGTGEAARTLVRDVSFAVGRGQTLGIVGESGSGKTMTARAIVGVLPEGVGAGGEVRFDGQALLGAGSRALRAVRGRRIGMVLQDPFTALNPLQSVGEHLRESLPGGQRRKRAAVAEEVGRRLGEVGLTARVADHYPFQLSGGMRQRVAIAAALCGDPELLIADEPTTALDVTTQAEVLALLQSLQRTRGMALVLITHDLRVAFSVCDRVLVMYAGSVVEDAPAVALAHGARHPYSLGLLRADPPVGYFVERLNAIPGTVPSADSVADRCAFAARCEWRAGNCLAGRPPLLEVGQAHRSACARLAEIEPELASRQQALFVPAEPAPPPRGASVLSVRRLSKEYRTASLVGRGRTAPAVKDVSFDVVEGEALGLVGETGSGKTTIARCILGLSSPTGGSITLAGVEIADRRALSREQRRQVVRLVQAVFQDPYSSLNPMVTIGATLAEAVAVRGGEGDPHGEVAALLEMVGLPASYARRRPAALSGGERQRVAIARAVAVRPRLLICDEPVAALDVSVQAQILELLRSLRSSGGTSMLFITHDLAVVRQMTDRLAVLREGEVVEQGDTQSVLDAPSHPYTARLVESIPGERKAVVG